MKLLTIVIIFLGSCAYKPVYNNDNSLSKYKIDIIVKSKENYGKITNLLKLHWIVLSLPLTIYYYLVEKMMDCQIM